MCVVDSGFGWYEIACGECGISLCWDIDLHMYLERPDFWDNWECKMCNPNYLREYSRKKADEEAKCIGKEVLQAGSITRRW